jgi:hypothetical protein
VFFRNRQAGQAGMLSAADMAAGHIKPVVYAVYFPLIAAIIPKWLGIVSAKPRFSVPGCRKILFLVSGAGLPRDPLADPANNSTEATAKLISFYIDTFFGDILTVPIHSAEAGMFRYGAPFTGTVCKNQYMRSFHPSPFKLLVCTCGRIR